MGNMCSTHTRVNVHQGDGATRTPAVRYSLSISRSSSDPSMLTLASIRGCTRMGRTFIGRRRTLPINALSAPSGTKGRVREMIFVLGTISSIIACRGRFFRLARATLKHPFVKRADSLFSWWTTGRRIERDHALLLRSRVITRLFRLNFQCNGRYLVVTGT